MEGKAVFGMREFFITGSLYVKSLRLPPATIYPFGCGTAAFFSGILSSLAVMGSCRACGFALADAHAKPRPSRHPRLRRLCPLGLISGSLREFVHQEGRAALLVNNLGNFLSGLFVRPVLLTDGGSADFLQSAQTSNPGASARLGFTGLSSHGAPHMGFYI